MERKAFSKTTVYFPSVVPQEGGGCRHREEEDGSVF